jgi:transcription elongation factor GreB
MPVYITPAGHARIVREYNWLMKTERPRITAEVAYAASLGDRSENAEYLYGKKRLREIDKRLHYLKTRLESIEVVDPAAFPHDQKVRFGATVELETEEGELQTWRICGEDEVDTSKGQLSYKSPIGRALIGKNEGDDFSFQAPGGLRQLSIVGVRYDPWVLEEDDRFNAPAAHIKGAT